MHYKTFVLLGIHMLLGLCTHAQENLTVSGYVKNSETLQPLEGAIIYNNNTHAVTNANGKFTLTNLLKGTNSFTITHLSYASKIETISITKNEKNITFYLKEATNSLKTVTVFGKSSRRKAKELSTILEPVSKKFLEENRDGSLMQTLQKIPGVSSSNVGAGQSKPVIRGLGFNRVAVVQNGIKHEAQQWGRDHALEIDQYNIENIQIVKGPASLLFGSDAIGGVVNILPFKTPLKNSFLGNINVIQETNNNLFGVSLGLQERKENWFYRTRVTFKDYGDYKVPTDKISYNNYVFNLDKNFLRNTAGIETNVSASVGYIHKNIKSELFVSNVNAKNGFFANAHGLEVRNSGISYDVSNRDIDFPFHKVNHFKVTNSTSIKNDNHTYFVDVGFQNNQREEHSEPVPHGFMPKPLDSKERQFHKNTFTLNVRNHYKGFENNFLASGVNVEYQKNTIDGWGFLIPNYKKISAGAYVYNNYEINPNFHFLAGLRYDYGVLETQSYFDSFTTPVTDNNGNTNQTFLQRALDKKLTFSNFSGSLGLSYINNATTYKINLGKSFRMPLANELASDGVNYHMYRFEKGNLNLKPEESYQLDVEFDYTGNLFGVKVSPFLNYFSNYIYLNPTATFNETLQVYEYTQAKVFRAGGEASIYIKPWTNVTLEASTEYVFAKQLNGDKKGFTLPFTPPLSGVLSASYLFKNNATFKNSQFNASYRITASQKEIVPPEEVTNGYQVLDLFFKTDIALFKGKLPITTTLKINNVLNTKYFNHTSFYRLIDVPEPGRNISASINIPF